MKDVVSGCCDRHTDDLVPYDDVRARLLSLVHATGVTASVPLADALGMTLHADVNAAMSMPPRDNSAVDGYALGPPGPSDSYNVQARIAAGDTAKGQQLAAGQAVRIFTGAPIPKGTFGVAMQEDATRDGDQVQFRSTTSKGQHIRRAGEDFAAGEMLIPAGSVLDPRHIAILAATGQTKIPALAPIRVAIFSSGKELCDPDTPLGPAAIHDSNRWMLRALLSGPSIQVLDYGILPDNRDAIADTLKKAAQEADLILSTGGVSVGEEDHVYAALGQAGGTPEQSRMAVKPGKPAVFGRLGRALFIGLPGNPVAALVSFTLLARPCLDVLSGRTPAALQPATGIAGFDWSRKPGRVEYFPAKISGLTADGMPVLQRLGQGGSALLQPLIAADGLARLDRGVDTIATGDRLDWFGFRAGFAL